MHHFHGDLGAAHTLARQAWNSVAGRDLQHTMESCARQAIQSAFPIK
jgi:hypothetical protein